MLVEHAAQWAWQAMGGTRIEVLCTFLVFLGVLLVARCLQWLRYVRSLPPGPWGVPVFGYLPFLKGDVHLRYGELAKKYGPMFSGYGKCVYNHVTTVMLDNSPPLYHDFSRPPRFFDF